MPFRRASVVANILREKFGPGMRLNQAVLFVYTKNSSRKYYVNHNTMARVGAKLGHALNCAEVGKT